MTMPDDTHQKIQDAFSAYVEDALAPAEKSSLEQHVAACLQCRTHLEQFRRAMEQLGALRVKAPPSFLPDIQRQIFTRSRGRFFGRSTKLFGRIPLEWLSLGMIVAMLIYFILTRQSSPTAVNPVP